MRIRYSALVASLFLMLSPLPVVSQSSVSSLSQQLQTAVGAKDWTQAIQIIDQLIPMAPTQAEQLRRYRSDLLRLQKLQPSTEPAGVSPSAVNRVSGEVHIKRRQAGVPVVDVTFNQRRNFEMLVDSGASLTVITRPMAKALGITPAQIVNTITVSTANGLTEMPIVYMGSIELGGHSLTQTEVAIAGPDMDIGLLGQDFLERYDVVIKRNSIQFLPRARN